MSNSKTANQHQQPSEDEVALRNKIKEVSYFDLQQLYMAMEPHPGVAKTIESWFINLKDKS